MTKSSGSLARTLGQLALALLNATLLLALALAVAGILLVGRVQNFAADAAAKAVTAIGPEVQARVAGDFATLDQALGRIGTIEARLADISVGADSAAAARLDALGTDVQALTAQLAALNDGIADLRRQGDGTLRAALHDLLAEAASALATPPAPPQGTP